MGCFHMDLDFGMLSQCMVEDKYICMFLLNYYTFRYLSKDLDYKYPIEIINRFNKMIILNFS